MTNVDPTFTSDPAVNPTTGLADPNAQTATAKTSAYDSGYAFLQSLGLDTPGLKTLLTNSVQNNVSTDDFSQQVQLSDDFKTRFPGIALARKNGFTAPSPATYIQYEGTLKTLEQTSGLPTGFLDNPDTVTRMIGGGVSAAEVQSRINDGYVKVSQAPDDVKQTLYQYYGLTPGTLAAHFLNEDSAAVQREVATASIGTEAARAGFGGISQQEASTLQGGGLTDAGAAQGFGKLAQERQLMDALPGEQGIGTITRAQQEASLLAPGGDTEQELQRRAALRRAQFAGGGGFASDQTGVTGLGQKPE